MRDTCRRFHGCEGRRLAYARRSACLSVASASAVLSGRRRGRESDAVGPAARHQGLLGHGPCCWPRCPSSRRRSISCPACSCSFGIHRRAATRTPICASRGCRPTACRADDVGYLLDNFFMVHPDHNDPPVPALPRAVREARLGGRSGRAGGASDSRSATFSICNAGRTWSGCTRWPSNSTRSWPRFATRGSIGPRAKSNGCWTSRWSCLREVIPLHEKLAERGQIELTTTPFYHPILPLLWDKRLARQAMPGRRCCRSISKAIAEDAASSRSAARSSYHEKLFGQKPRGHVALGRLGLPRRSSRRSPRPASSGSPPTKKSSPARPTAGSPATARLSPPSRNALSAVARRGERASSLQIIFRDHAMSDQIGFHYQRDARRAGRGRFHRQARSHRPGDHRRNAGHRPTLVSIILDGENCWEYYPNGGVDFLRELYRRVVAASEDQARRVSATISSDIPATDKIGHLFAGSWISHNFGIWIGHPECNRAWDLAVRDAAAFRGRRRRGQEDRTSRSSTPGKSCTSPRGATGSGGSATVTPAPRRTCSTGCSASICRTFTSRSTTRCRRSCCTRSGRRRPQPRLYTQPTSLLDVKVDGRQTYFEWLNAGRYVPRGDRGTMSSATPGRVDGLVVRFRRRAAVLAAGCTRAARSASSGPTSTSLRITFLQPQGFELLVGQAGGAGADRPALPSQRARERFGHASGGRRRSSNWPFRGGVWQSHPRIKYTGLSN